MSATSLPARAAPPQPGRPATEEGFLPFSAPWFGDEEKREVLAVLDSDWITTGPRVKQFEADFAACVGTSEAVAVNSCTGALHIALAALEIGPGDAVITSPLTFAATANVIVHRRARPIFLDVRPDTYNLDATKLEKYLRERCRRQPADGTLRVRDTGECVRAVIPVHYAGHPCEMEAINALAEEFRLAVVEDAAHGLGAAYRGRKVGNLGRAACFSFYPTKNISTGEGGMLATNDSELARRARLLALHGISKDAWKRYGGDGSWQYDLEECGFKYNLTDLAAALGLHQLRKLEGFQARRAHLAGLYREQLAGLPLRHPTVLDSVVPAWHLYAVQVLAEKVSRDQVIEELRRRNIGASVHFLPLHLMTFYQRRYGFRRGDFPVTESVTDRILSLPLFPRMADTDVARVARALRQILAG